jgi:glutathione S-transferase
VSTLTLVIGNKNYSSWSLRPWFALKRAGIPFAEVRIPLRVPQTRERILEYSPSAKVPLLVDGAIKVWESLAILEYLAEKYPQKCGWPADPAVRAHARSAAAEMHAGFAALRTELPMNCRARRSGVVPSAAACEDIDRILALWRGARESHGRAGPWLFGAPSPADAMFAPVALRFLTYGVAAPGPAGDFVGAVRDAPAIREWLEDARKEPEVIEEVERGIPA